MFILNQGYQWSSCVWFSHYLFPCSDFIVGSFEIWKALQMMAAGVLDTLCIFQLQESVISKETGQVDVIINTLC